MSREIVIIGAGPIGSILAAHLIKAGKNITIIDSGPRAKQIMQQGIVIKGQVEIEATPNQVLSNIADLERPEMVIICTKTTSLKGILPLLQKKISRTAAVISWQNGIDTEEELKKILNKNRVGRAVVNFAGGVEKSGEVNMIWFNAPNFLGMINNQDQECVKDLIDALNKSNLTTELIATNDIKKHAFFKGMLNAALCPICSLLNLTMSKAMDNPHARHLAEEVVAEALLLATKLNFDYGDDALTKAMAYLEKGGDHLPSMAIDLQNNLPTEIAFMNGKLVELGDEHHLDLSVNRTLTSLIGAMECSTNNSRS